MKKILFVLSLLCVCQWVSANNSQEEQQAGQTTSPSPQCVVGMVCASAEGNKPFSVKYAPIARDTNP